MQSNWNSPGSSRRTDSAETIQPSITRPVHVPAIEVESDQDRGYYSQDDDDSDIDEEGYYT